MSSQFFPQLRLETAIIPCLAVFTLCGSLFFDERRDHGSSFGSLCLYLLQGIQDEKYLTKKLYMIYYIQLVEERSFMDINTRKQRLTSVWEQIFGMGGNSESDDLRLTGDPMPRLVQTVT